MRPFMYILDSQHNPIPLSVEEYREGIEWFEKIANRRVAWTEVEGYQVSTVFLAYDHNYLGAGEPILYETMVFGPGVWEDYQNRYRTWDEAEKGHQWVVSQILQGMAP